MKRTTFCITVVVIGIFSAVIPAQGASPGVMRVYLSTGTTTVPIGSMISLKMMVDTALPVNAYDFTVSFPSDALDFVTSDNSRSLIDVWQTTPLISASTISFKGGSLKPFYGDHGELLTLNFRAKGIGDADIGFQRISLYLANGKGTKIIPSPDNLTLHIVPAGAVPVQGNPPEFFDHIPPTIKYLAFIANPFDTQEKLLGFQVADAGSGIKQVFLRTRQFVSWSDFVTAINPTALPTGVWMAELHVVDNSGNASDRVIYDWGAFARGPLIIGGALLVLFFGGWYFTRRRAR